MVSTPVLAAEMRGHDAQSIVSLPLRIVFLGSDPIALPLLDWLAGEGSASARLLAVFTQPDRPTGRGQKVQPNAIKGWALAHGLPVHQPEKLAPEVRTGLETLAPDVALVMAYGHILRDDFIQVPGLGTLNLHTSLLPQYRGASPIQTAVAAGERETGVTLMRIVRKLDAGPIAAVERVPIELLDTAADVERKLAAACVPLLARALPAIAAGTLAFTPQDDALATYCRKLEKTDGALDFSAPASVLAARINGLFPWPCCAIEIGGVTIKIGRADVAAGAVLPTGAAPGAILGHDETGMLVAASEGVLRLRQLQRPGARMLATPEFFRGFPIVAGTVLPSKPMPPLVSVR